MKTQPRQIMVVEKKILPDSINTIATENDIPSTSKKTNYSSDFSVSLDFYWFDAKENVNLLQLICKSMAAFTSLSKHKLELKLVFLIMLVKYLELYSISIKFTLGVGKIRGHGFIGNQKWYNWSSTEHVIV